MVDAEGYRNGLAFMKANADRYGVREGIGLLRDAVTNKRYKPAFIEGMCDALIQRVQERSIRHVSREGLCSSTGFPW
jgi:hypothetical protein